ncbi:MAG: hypothetical protein Pars2KO_18050 [Parasphingorhabdus sp.]
MRKFCVSILVLILAGCGQILPEGDDVQVSEPSSLEKAAIDAGVIPDINSVTLSGAFERQSDLGTDRFCAVGNDEKGYQVGMIAVFGPESNCEALGEATRTGESIQINLTSEDRCSFTASFDGVEIKIPGSLPDSCESYCSPRAGFNGVSFYIVGEGDEVARSTRGREIESLCP